MFRVILLGLAFATAMGCSTNAANSTAAKGGRITVGFLSNNAYDFWLIARKGTEKAARELGVTVDFQMPAQGTAAEQRQLIEDMLTRGVTAIAVSPNDPANQAE